MNVADLSPTQRAHVYLALQRYVREQCRNGHPALDWMAGLAEDVLHPAYSDSAVLPAIDDGHVDLVGVGLAAHKLGISDRTIRRLVAHGDLAPVRVGRRCLFLVEDIETFARAHRAARNGQNSPVSVA